MLPTGAALPLRVGGGGFPPETPVQNLNEFTVLKNQKKKNLAKRRRKDPGDTSGKHVPFYCCWRWRIDVYFWSFQGNVGCSAPWLS